MNDENRKKIEDIAKYKCDMYMAKKMPEMSKNIERNLTDHGKALMGEYYLTHEKRINLLSTISSLGLLVSILVAVSLIIMVLI